MPRLTSQRKAAIIAAVKAGRTIPEIHAMTGEAARTISYTAAAHGLTIASRYQRVARGTYWQELRGRYWRALNAQLPADSLR